MVYINEWLPNPVGTDTGAEWIELFNDGQNSVSLNGWVLVSGSRSAQLDGGKKFILNGNDIGAGQYLVLNPADGKITLRNSDGSLLLYDAQGKLVDQSSFSGVAPEGKSYSLIEQNSSIPPFQKEAASLRVGGFVFADPTPGAMNKTITVMPPTKNYLVGQPLNKPFGMLDIIGLALFVGLIYPIFIIALFKKNEYLSKLFFGRD